MKITLLVNGQERTFSEEELTTILNEYFKQGKYFKIDATHIDRWFEINPKSIDRKLFILKRSNEGEEKLRQLILEAFKEVDKNPKYNIPFKTIYPVMRWVGTPTMSGGIAMPTIEEYEKIVENIGGDHMADWVEQALEWAQRISDGEEWIYLCYGTDSADWCRLVKWKNGETRLVGGASKSKFRWTYPPCHISSYNYSNNTEFGEVVPLIVEY